jgi:predicted GIY-YIG superfamily endonuclease
MLDGDNSLFRKREPKGVRYWETRETGSMRETEVKNKNKNKKNKIIAPREARKDD